MRTRARSCRGQLLVEFALLLPLYVVLLWTLLWFGQSGRARLSAEIAARNASLRKAGWSAPTEDPGRRAIERAGNVRTARVCSEPYRARGRSLEAKLSASLAPMLATRQGTAAVDCEPLPYPHPGRRDKVRWQAAFVVDPIVDASDWRRRVKSLFGIRSPPVPRVSR